VVKKSEEEEKKKRKKKKERQEKVDVVDIGRRWWLVRLLAARWQTGRTDRMKGRIQRATERPSVGGGRFGRDVGSFKRWVLVTVAKEINVKKNKKKKAGTKKKKKNWEKMEQKTMALDCRFNTGLKKKKRKL